jgi:pimeloyl-ACP methyl ester carboxylesterase
MMEDNYIEIEGCSIRYRDTGKTGPVVLLLHGIGESLEFWAPQLDTLADKVRLIALDLPGHGLSGIGDQPYEQNKFASFVWRFTDKLNLEKAYLVGNSLGGAISILMAGEKPQRVSGLLLANAAGLGKESPIPFRLMTLPVLGEILTKPGKTADEQQIKALFYDQSIASDEFRQIISRNGSQPGHQQAFLKTLRLMTNFFGQRSEWVSKEIKTLGSLDMPVLFIHGRKDLVIPVEHTIEAQKRTPNSNLVVFEDCGHTPQLEKPEDFNKHLMEFIGAS